MRRREFSNKVKEIRDSIIIDIKELSDDKDNLTSNVKTMKELTSILRELDKIIDSNGEEQRMEAELDKEDFFDCLMKRSEIDNDDLD